jgi:peptidoglycan/xylan/chitin deacetylase (PgdA/CDA1 family)
MSSRDLIARTLRPFTSVYSRLRPGIRVLMYHRVRDTSPFDQLSVSLSRFEEQMAYLAAHCRLLCLDDALDELAAGNPLAGVVVTFDDGYLDNLTNALPIMKRHGIPATVFVTSAFCDQAKSHPRYRDEPRLHMNWDEVRELAASPLIRIGSHTLTHPFLTRLGEQDAWSEISESRKRLLEQIPRPIDVLCYPSGDAGKREFSMARSAGYKAAVTVAPGVNRDLDRPFELRRTEITDQDDPQTLECKLHGALDLPHGYLHWKRMRAFRKAARPSPVSLSVGVSQ